MPCLIIISGPIGSGKSTLAMELGRRVRSSGRSAAVIDLDLVYDMLDHREKSDAAVWFAARQTAAVLTDHFCSSGVELVVVEGSFWDIGERAAFLETLTTPLTPHFVTLRVSFDHALQRVESDPTRGIRRVALSRDPAVLARNHADFVARSAAVSAGDLVIDTDTIGTAALAELLLTRPSWDQTSAPSTWSATTDFRLPTEMSNTLYALCGLPFAGKSTVARELATRTIPVLVSLDAINGEYGAGLDGAAISADQWQRTYAEAYRRIAEHLLQGQSVIFDHGNFSRAERDQVRAIGAQAGARVQFVYVPVTPAEAWRRLVANRETRERQDVLNDNFELALRMFEPPDAEVDVVRVAGKGNRDALA